MKTLALAALLASAATAAPAAVTIHFTGTTFEGGSFSHSTESGYDFAEGTYDVEGTLVIDTDHVNDGAFITASFTSFGGFSPVIFNVGTADDSLAYTFGAPSLTFGRTQFFDESMFQNASITFFSNSEVPTRLYGGVELPDFLQADQSDLWFNVSGKLGTEEDYVEQFSLGQVTSVTVTEDTPAVPEPASWAMMIGGFGLVGGALRRRRTSVSFA